MEKNNQMPIFDPAAIKAMSEEQIDEYGRAYTEAVENFVRESVASTLAPVIDGIAEQSERERRAREADGDLPVFARSAAGTASLPKTPKTLSDASAEARKRFA